MNQWKFSEESAFTIMRVDGGEKRIIDLPAIAGDSLSKLPVVLRLLLENVVRCMQGSEREQAVNSLLSWVETGTSEKEIECRPVRVLMHDTTSTPALVDIAAMRDALAEAGFDPKRLNPVLPVDVSVDHSLAVEVFARDDAATVNLGHEMRRNRERYTFLKWATKALDGVHVNPPGTGIMHTINLEQLATVVTHEVRGGRDWLIPEVMIGTDSHTPMINGIGVLGWGVGGLEAQTVMFGMPTMLRIPDVIGVRFVGALRSGVTATDLALTVTHRLRAIEVSGEFVEFFGPGVASLSAGARSVVSNMAPEYGATTGFFPIDERSLAYLQATGRAGAHTDMVEAYARRMGLWFDPLAAPRYTRVIEIDLTAVDMHIAGPRRPQDLLHFAQARDTLAALNFQPAAKHSVLPRHPIAIAAITSCTNTTDPALLISAGLVARKARNLGLRVPAWVKTSLGPGSPAARSYLQRAGLLEDLAAVGFDVVGYGCTTCIGNSGPMPERIRDAAQAGTIQPVAVLSGNRNFPGRIHPDLDLGFLMSPPLVIVFALAGNAEIDLSSEPVQIDAKGDEVYLSDLWPDHAEVTALVAKAVDPGDFRHAFLLASQNPAWEALASPESACFPWQAESTALRRPPFASLDQTSQLGHYVAYPLMILGDDVTTDHISPASAIPPYSLVANYLVEHGEDRGDLNVFASRRGNWEVMLRGTFHSKSLKNFLADGLPMAHTLHVPSGDVAPVWDVAKRYHDDGDAVVLVAGERYGTGSSRDWAAKGQRLLGIRAVLASSFERIHRSNLIGMGILPLIWPKGVDVRGLRLKVGDRIEVNAIAATLGPRCGIEVRILRSNGTIEKLQTTAAVETQMEVHLLRNGGVIPSILKHTLEKA